MQIFRTSEMPASYTKLDFVRKGKGAFLDAEEDLDRIRFFQKAVNGQVCLSNLKIRDGYIILKAEVSSDILNCTGGSGKTIEYDVFYWRPDDKKYILSPRPSRPYEAVSLEAAGIDKSFLASLSDNFVFVL